MTTVSASGAVSVTVGSGAAGGAGNMTVSG